ncbi:MAG: hypothetical protein PHP53_19525 [Prolixibacteraceae bacterium]|nr:hypothetical protein [Prolixibacteraceae bacterium]
MRLFLFGVSVFYLLGLKLTSRVEIKSSLSVQPAIDKTKVFPEQKENAQPLEVKPELIKKDTAISVETKNIRPISPSAKTQKNLTFPRS